MKFFCKRPGGWKVKDAGGEVEVELLQGTREKGPFYDSYAFSDHRLAKWEKMGIIEMIE